MAPRYVDNGIFSVLEEIHIINMQMMRIQRYDQCGEYIDGFDVQESNNCNVSINWSYECNLCNLHVPEHAYMCCYYYVQAGTFISREAYISIDSNDDVIALHSYSNFQSDISVCHVVKVGLGHSLIELLNN